MVSITTYIVYYKKSCIEMDSFFGTMFYVIEIVNSFMHWKCPRARVHGIRGNHTVARFPYKVLGDKIVPMVSTKTTTKNE